MVSTLDDNGVSALGLYNFGISYLNCADQLFANFLQPDLLPKPFKPAFTDPIIALYGQALELVTKAHLRREGASLNKLRKVGHDIWQGLGGLSPECIELHGFCDDDRLPVAYLSELHRQRLTFYFCSGVQTTDPLESVFHTMSKCRLNRFKILQIFGKLKQA